MRIRGFGRKRNLKVHELLRRVCEEIGSAPGEVEEMKRERKRKKKR
jgi:hypothetical protein